ncbi:hypothetical protein CO115_03760 [Candidatus Falkowbacteria bacterium CG_4_9_14_3_um_filter_36_9]|uniref:Uncharacterized protein n=1 Tax=Candidatus Falkowbacteria bacterium CG02_land_8_20_14_3_00_36_14 TaxID=1974560 RepID=A0A2M7DKJ9_9BACT|nr:MAG: hypothetical protein COS18_05390 [Candidatus Falkowbacteria bacterium CG02_land_8_20_14_3_00_36_14]PJA10913.1 MAG: hypothetical protein COX67_02545 [Candidatus Falkowbacteria bacterium CG_4_10_14_0_2_um_filter_36_22]PJB18805.1 MAG: hypothetical protein CO115_03760 [Candidatus Falkowbacteria bacterium CG_4_9_14_3_um_filter_36_9]
MLRQRRSRKPNARAGKKEGGWGEDPEGVALRPYGVKIFARPRLEPVCLWRIPIFPPPPNFVFRKAKCAAKKKDVVFTLPSRARTTNLPPLLS